MGGSRVDMKIVFFATPDYVLPILKELFKQYHIKKGEDEILAVVTQSPKKVGRKQFIERTDIDNWAYKHDIHVVYSPDEAPDADLGIVAAYGKIISDDVIKRFKYGVLNIHPSLLPKYRGASPVQAALAAGDKKTGLTIIKMDEEMDHGPIVSSFPKKINENDNNETLRNALFEESVDFLIKLIPNYISGKITLKPQKHDEATYTRLITKEDGYINPFMVLAAMEGKSLADEIPIGFIKNFNRKHSPDTIHDIIRALHPWPGAWTTLVVDNESNHVKRIKLISSHVEDGKLILDQVQLEGKTEVSWKQFTQGYPSWEFVE